MFLVIGLLIVFGSILFGYTMHHGSADVLIRGSESIIGGAAPGASQSGTHPGW